MRRRRGAIGAISVAALVVLVLLAVSVSRALPQPARMYRIGIMTVEPDVVLRQSLRELGYVEGQNTIFELRNTGGRPERADAVAAELVKLKADVIVATNPMAVFSAKRATSTVPIVMVHTPDPVQLGLVASLARPGGNITGVTSLSVDLSLKQIELVKEMVPRASRIAMLWNPANPWHPIVVKSLRERNPGLGAQLDIVAIRGPDDFDSAFSSMVKERVRAVLLLADPMTFVHRRRLAEIAVKQRLPLIAGPRGYTESGALMSYWADETELYRRAASYVDRILKGASPDSLPIEQPTQYQLVVNIRTAKALALTIPPSLLLRATVVE